MIAALFLTVLCTFFTLFLNALRDDSPNRVTECKHGTFVLNDFDIDISKHMGMYGEWEENALQMMLSLISEGDIVVDVGANIGAFTVPFADKVGPMGKVVAFEPQKIINQRLNANIVLNDLENVDVYLAALGKENGTIDVPIVNYASEANFGSLSLAEPLINQTPEWTYQVPLYRLDEINLYNPYTRQSCPSLIKMDVERMETNVLRGGATMIQRCRPFIHSENNALGTSAGLIDHFYSIDYVPFWDLQPAFSPSNYFGSTEDDSGGYVNMNIFCIPREKLDTEGGFVSMLGFTQVQRDRPYLHQYPFHNRFGTPLRQHGELPVQ